jgi:GxxExxY protein
MGLNLNNVSSAFLNDVAAAVLDAAIEVHREMGPGLLESVYHQCLAAELEMRGMELRTLEPVALHYKGMSLDKSFVIDILVENEVIVELKSVETILPVHEAQVISYLKLANKRLGLLINFNAPLLKHGFKRFVNGL